MSEWLTEFPWAFAVLLVLVVAILGLAFREALTIDPKDWGGDS